MSSNNTIVRLASLSSFMLEVVTNKIRRLLGIAWYSVLVYVSYDLVAFDSYVGGY